MPVDGELPTTVDCRQSFERPPFCAMTYRERAIAEKYPTAISRASALRGDRCRVSMPSVSLF